MLKDSPELSNMFNGEQRKLFLVVSRLGKGAKPPPGSARWMRDDGASTRPVAGVAIDVPHVAAWEFLVDRVLSSEQNSNLP